VLHWLLNTPKGLLDVCVTLITREIFVPEKVYHERWLISCADDLFDGAVQKDILVS
jgi:hypothetical protein